MNHYVVSLLLLFGSFAFCVVVVKAGSEWRPDTWRRRLAEAIAWGLSASMIELALFARWDWSTFFGFAAGYALADYACTWLTKKFADAYVPGSPLEDEEDEPADEEDAEDEAVPVTDNSTFTPVDPACFLLILKIGGSFFKFFANPTHPDYQPWVEIRDREGDWKSHEGLMLGRGEREADAVASVLASSAFPDNEELAAHFKPLLRGFVSLTLDESDRLRNLPSYTIEEWNALHPKKD